MIVKGLKLKGGIGSIFLFFLMISVLSSNSMEVKPKCVVFIKNYLERCYPTAKPKKEDIKNEVRIFASPGEYEPFTFSIRAFEDMEKVKIEINDLRCKNNVIPNNNIDIQVVETFNRWVDPIRYIRTECFLVKRETIDIPKDTTQRFWVTVHIPEDTKSGNYYSKIMIKVKEKTIKTLNLIVEVLPIKLLPPEGMAYFMYYDTARLPKFAQNQEYQKKCFIDMREHGLTTTTLYLYPLVKGKFTLTERNNGHLGFIPTLRTLEETKLVPEGIPVIWLGAECYGISIWNAVLREAKKRNWPELLFYVVDEPGSEDRDKRVKAVMERINHFRKSHPEYKIRTTTAIGKRGIETVGEYYDIWICSAMDINEEMIDKARKSAFCFTGSKRE